MGYYKKKPIYDYWEKTEALKRQGIDPLSAARLAWNTDVIFA